MKRAMHIKKKVLQFIKRLNETEKETIERQV